MARMPTDYAIVMHRFALTSGVDILEGLPVSRADLEARDFIPFDLHEELLRRFHYHHPDPEWGFRLGSLFSMGTHGPAGFGAMSASTIRNGLAFMGRYFQTRTCYADCRLEYHNHDLRVIFDLVPRATPQIHRHCETISFIWQTYIESAGASATSTTWHFPYDPPDHSGIYEKWLHGKVQFNSKAFQLDVPHAVGEVPSPFRNDAAFKSTTSQCEAILMEVSAEPLIEKVRGILASRIERRVMESIPITDVPSADEVAAHLQVSRRTLIRQLKDAGTSFQSIKDELRRQHLSILLASDDLKLAEVADRLGYAEPANFTRSCKRMLGQTPADVRRRLHNGEKFSELVHC